MLDLARDGYTHDEVVHALHNAGRTVSFEYDLLDNTNRKIKTLSKVTSGAIKFGALNSIKRTATFTLSGDEGINFLQHRIRPYMLLKMPKPRIVERIHYFLSHNQPMTVEDDVPDRAEWVRFPLGIYLLSSPTQTSTAYNVQRSITAYGLMQVLHDDKFLDTYTVNQGVLVVDAVVGILSSAGINDYNISPSDKVVPRTIQFDIGTKKAEAVNELLSIINYTPIYDDADGYFTSGPYRPPSERPVDYVYKDDSQSVILQGVEEELDLFGVPNVFVVVRTNPEETPLKSVLTNDNANSPLATINRGRNIVEYREINDIADQETLDAYTQRVAFEASQVYGRIRWQSSLMPIHSYSNVLQFDFGQLGISGKYLELAWEMQLATGGTMTHELRQVVAL